MTPTVISGNLLQLHLIGTLLSAVVYGLLTSIFSQCLVLLITNRKNSYTNRTRWFLITYTVTMFLLSTVAIIQAFVYIARAIRHGVDQTSLHILQQNEPITLPLAIWGADGFMLWRCMMLYTNALKLQRNILKIVLFFSGFTSFGCGILYYLAPHLSAFTHKTSLPILVTTIAISITAVVNFILASLISGRLWLHQEGMRRVLGPQYGSPYLKIIVICLEGCMPIVLTSLAFVIMFALGDRARFSGSIVPLLLLPHVCVLSPMLIIYHVARGRAATTLPLRSSEIITPNIAGDNFGGRDKKPIQFNNNHSLADSMTRSSSRPHSLGDVELVGASSDPTSLSTT